MRLLTSPNAQELVSGVPAEMRSGLHAHFLEVLRKHCPQAFEEATHAPDGEKRSWWKDLARSCDADPALPVEAADGPPHESFSFSFL